MLEHLNTTQRQLLVTLGLNYLWGEDIKAKAVVARTPSAAAREAPSQRREVLTQYGEAPSQGHEVPVQLGGVPTQGSEAPTQGAEGARAQLMARLGRNTQEGRQAKRQAWSQVEGQRVSQASVATSHHEMAKAVLQPAVVESTPLTQLSWDELHAKAQACHACELHTHRAPKVFGSQGAAPDPRSDWLFLELVPSVDDERTGEVMSGEAGVLFDQMLQAIGLKRSDVMVLPILKCRPLGSKPIDKSSFEACSPFLLEQIRRIAPKCIVAFGDAAAALFQRDEGAGALRRQSLLFEHPEQGQIPVVASFSLTHLLSDSSAKAMAWEDLKRAHAIVSQGA